MRVLLQRVLEARVEVEGQITGAIGRGLLLLVGIENADTPQDIEWMAGKLARLRIFPDDNGIMNRSLQDCGGEVLAVSQFTLYGECSKGNRPSWGRAAKGDISQPLFDAFVQKLATTLCQPVPTGVFGTNMQVHLVNDGPVTLMLDSRSAC
jgi:D-tyrosyl-tRNA(Tyr) deacylase